MIIRVTALIAVIAIAVVVIAFTLQEMLAALSDALGPESTFVISVSLVAVTALFIQQFIDARKSRALMENLARMFESNAQVDRYREMTQKQIEQNKGHVMRAEANRQMIVDKAYEEGLRAGRSAGAQEIEEAEWSHFDEESEEGNYF